MGHRSAQGSGTELHVLQHVPTQSTWPTLACLPLTLVLDEAVGCQQLQRVHLEEHAVEEEVVGRGPAGWVPGQAGEDELLGCGEKRQVVGWWRLSALAPPWEERRCLEAPRLQRFNPHTLPLQGCRETSSEMHRGEDIPSAARSEPDAMNWRAARLWASNTHALFPLIPMESMSPQRGIPFRRPWCSGWYTLHCTNGNSLACLEHLYGHLGYSPMASCSPSCWGQSVSAWLEQ